VLTLAVLLVKAFLAGGISALPFGPMGILCLQRTLDHGRRAGMIAAAGIALALGLWGVMVAQGMHQVSVWFAGKEGWVRLGLGLALIATGLSGMRSKPLVRAGPSTAPCLGGFISTFCAVLGNPVTIVTLASVFAILGLVQVHLDWARALGLMMAIVLGAMTLWLGMAEMLVRLHRRWGDATTLRVTRWLNVGLLVSGLLYILAGD
jgi:putative LysE/RhtB family amino acid efflux pump